MSLSNYTRIKKLGQGSFGAVFLVRNNQDGKPYVMKEVDVGSLGPKGRKDALKEVGFLNKLDHPSIISYNEFFEEEPQRGAGKKMLYIVMEYADGGDLSAKVKAQAAKHKAFAESQVIDWLVQVCLGLKHMHDRKIIHRDIKSENIFLTKENLVKIGDFGISKQQAHTLAKAMTRIGTPYYLSPEICLNKPYNSKTDMWSLGIVLYEMMALKLPFDANSMENLLKNIIRGVPPPTPRHFSKELRAIVDSLLQKDPNRRPTVHQVLNLPVIQAQIKKFLSDHEINAEFSHTILHSYQYKPVVAPGEEKEPMYEMPAIAEVKSPEEVKTPQQMMQKPFSQQRKEAAEQRRQAEEKEREKMAMDVRAAAVQKAVDDAKAARAQAAAQNHHAAVASAPPQPQPPQSARPPMSAYAPAAARPQLQPSQQQLYAQQQQQGQQPRPPPSSYGQQPASARPPVSARPNGSVAPNNNLYVPGGARPPSQQHPPPSSAGASPYGGYPWREQGRPGPPSSAAGHATPQQQQQQQAGSEARLAARREAERKQREDDLARIRQNYFRERQERQQSRVQGSGFSVFGPSAGGNALVAPPSAAGHAIAGPSAAAPPMAAQSYPPSDVRLHPQRAQHRLMEQPSAPAIGIAAVRRPMAAPSYPSAYAPPSRAGGGPQSVRRPPPSQAGWRH